jgi:threonine dehydratase
MTTPEAETDSAGNHGSSFAYAAWLLGVRATVFGPETMPQAKEKLIREYGADVIKYGSCYSDAAGYRQREHQKHPGRFYVPPFDHPDVVLHQGTMAAEIFQDYDGEVDYIFMGVGGGGGIGGIGQYVHHLGKKTRVIGVQTEGSQAMNLSLKAGKLVTLDHVDTAADGIAVTRVSDYTRKLAEKFVHEMVIVSEVERAQALVDLEDSGMQAEGAGALALAGMRKFFKYNPQLSGNAIGILSGRNRDDARLAADRELVANSYSRP